MWPFSDRPAQVYRVRPSGPQLLLLVRGLREPWQRGCARPSGLGMWAPEGGAEEAAAPAPGVRTDPHGGLGSGGGKGGD